jgi:hypothetical protein
MAKRKHTFGMKYLAKQHFGIAIIKGEQFYWVTDGYTNWKMVDFDPAVGPSSAVFAVWPK